MSKIITAIWNYFVEWCKDYQAFQREMNEMGIFNIPHLFGVATYIDKESFDRISKNNDRSYDIPKNNRHLKD